MTMWTFWISETSLFFSVHVLKGIVHPKKENPVIICSLSYEMYELGTQAFKLQTGWGKRKITIYVS